VRCVAALGGSSCLISDICRNSHSGLYDCKFGLTYTLTLRSRHFTAATKKDTCPIHFFSLYKDLFASLSPSLPTSLTLSLSLSLSLSPSPSLPALIHARSSSSVCQELFVQRQHCVFSPLFLLHASLALFPRV
jgi:hypothetical protein